MTQTLRRERKQKFIEILKKYFYNHEAEMLDTVVEDLLNAAESRSEKFDTTAADPIWSILAGEKITDKQLAKQQEIDDFEKMIETQLARFPLNWSGFKGIDQDHFRHHLKEAAAKGETLTAYMDWWIANKVEKESPPWTLGQIIIRWPQAFVDKKFTSLEEQGWK